MKETQFYTCAYCFKDFEPNRRRVQKYCSNTCRSKAYYARKAVATAPISSVIESKTLVPKLEKKQKIERMSAAGVGNAALGTLTADAAKALFTPEDNKAATKGDLKRLAAQLNVRYHLVRNIPPAYDGSLPYFDLDTREIVYFPKPKFLK